MRFLSKSFQLTAAFLFLTALYFNDLPAQNNKSGIKFTSSDLPIVIINANGQTIPYNDPRIVADMGVIDNGAGRRNNVSDPYNNYSGKISIKIHGQSSAGWDKKSYGLETENADGSNCNVALMGLPKENDWILYAPYYDRSLMRNVLTFRLSREMGWYASRTRYCELILNDTYRGLYVLMEKIKRDKNRVAINKLTPDEISGDEVSGGYILRIDKEPWNPGFDSPYLPFPNASAGIRYQYRYPKAENIVPEQEAYIKGFIYTFENLMHDSVYSDPLNGYAKYLNVASFVDYVLINELSRNVDGYRLSAYFYKDKKSKGGKLTAGPLWDYNFSYGNVGYYDAWKIAGWQLIFFADNAYFHQVDCFFEPFWWKPLFQEPRFAGKLKTRWQALRQTVLAKESVYAIIDSLANRITEARQRNFEIWPGPGNNNLGEGWFPPLPPDWHVKNYNEEIQYLKNWISERLDWLDVHTPLLTALPAQKRKTHTFAFQLQQNYPNPFNSDTVIRYILPVSGFVNLSIYNILGQKVKEPVNRMQQAGRYALTFNAGALAGGVYYYKLTINRKFIRTQKFILLK